MPRRKKLKTILIVDGEDRELEAMRRILEEQGYQILEAQNYWDAVHAQRSHADPVDMLVTAIALPGNNGYELAKTMSEFNPDLRLLFVSGATGAEVSRYYNMPVSGSHLLAKPFQAEELVRRVGKAFRARTRSLRANSA